MKGKLLCIGKGGHTIHYPSRKEGSLNYGPSTLSGYITNADEATRDSAKELAKGATIIDKIPAIDHGQGVRMAIRGPMVNVDLNDDQTDECPEPSEIMATAMMADPGNQFGHLLALQKVHKMTSNEPGPLDHVSIAVYASMWKQAGARVGTWNGQTIEWED